MNLAKETAAKAKDAAVKYSKFWLSHVKKGEMPWTQWHCCGVVDGHEVSFWARVFSWKRLMMEMFSARRKIIGCIRSVRSVVIGFVRGV